MINIATNGMFGGMGYGGGGPVVVAAGGTGGGPIRREYAELNKPSIKIGKVEFGDKSDQEQLQRTITIKSIK